MLKVADSMAERSKEQYIPAATIASIYVRAGDYERAIDWCEEAYEHSDPNAPYFGVNSKDSEIRNHPRFRALLHKMGLDYWADYQ